MKLIHENWRRFLTESPPGSEFREDQIDQWYIKEPSKEPEERPHQDPPPKEDVEWGHFLRDEYENIHTATDAKAAGLPWTSAEQERGHAISIGEAMQEIDDILAEKKKSRLGAALKKLLRNIPGLKQLGYAQDIEAAVDKLKQIGSSITDMTTGKERASMRTYEIIQQFPILDKFDLSPKNWGAPSEMLAFREHYKRYMAKQVDAWSADAYSVPLAAIDDINVVFERWKEKRYAEDIVQESLFENWRKFLAEE
tara:strand:- start:629 stop:1387 length:759 start_codon:yes stop_codon:yes gene_type:complete